MTVNIYLLHYKAYIGEIGFVLCSSERMDYCRSRFTDKISAAQNQKKILVLISQIKRYRMEEFFYLTVYSLTVNSFLFQSFKVF